MGRVYLVARCPLDSSWYISSVEGNVDPRIARNKINYYVAENGLQQSMDPNVPPRIAWEPRPFLAKNLDVIVYPHTVDFESPPLPVERIVRVVTQSPANKNTCVTCLELFNEEEQEPRGQLICCGHCIHRLCLDRMLIKSFYKCPICRCHW